MLHLWVGWEVECPLHPSCSSSAIASFAGVATCFVAPGEGDGNPLVTPSSLFQHLEQRWVARLRKGLCVCQGRGCGISDLCCLKFAMTLRTPTLACLSGGDLSVRGFLGSPKATPCAVCLSWLCHVWFVRKAAFKCSCCHA